MKITLPSTGRYMMGGDPELFLVTDEGHIAPLHNTPIPKDSWSGMPIGHRDGCAFELNTKPSLCRGLMLESVGKQIYQVNSFAKANGWTMSMQAKRRILKASLKDAPKDMMQGGCDPDYDAYSGTIKAPDAYSDGFRYAGGHVHFGIADTKMDKFETIEMYAGAVRLLDLWVGLPLTAILGKKHAAGEAARRRYYGQAGSFRVQPHGLEYRTPSSALWSDPVLLSAILGMARIVVNSYFHKNGEGTVPDRSKADAALKSLRLLDEGAVRQIIDLSDYRSAQTFCMEALYPSVGYIEKDVYDPDSATYDAIVTGMAAMTMGAMNGEFLSDDVAQNWKNANHQTGPAGALSQRTAWPFYKYVKEFTRVIQPAPVPLQVPVYTGCQVVNCAICRPYREANAT